MPYLFVILRPGVHTLSRGWTRDRMSRAAGVGGSASTNTFIKDLPLFIAFVLLAGYTYVSGLRAPALIAFIKDTLIYVTVIVAIIYIPIKIGPGACPGEPGTHFGGSTAPIPFFGQNGYIALTAFVINVIIAVVLTLIFRAARVPAGADETQAPHYTADAGEPAVKELPELVEDTR